MTLSYAGGAPLLRDAPALDLANTHYAVRAKVREGLSSALDLGGWLQALMPEKLSITSAEAVTGENLAQFLVLRTAIRGVAEALTSEISVSATDISVINDASRAAPSWPQLTMSADGALKSECGTLVPELEQALAALAGDAVDLFSGERAAQLRACQAPGCPLFFLKDHPRREWCSGHCGARVRSTRAYRKRTATPT